MLIIPSQWQPCLLVIMHTEKARETARKVLKTKAPMRPSTKTRESLFYVDIQKGKDGWGFIYMVNAKDNSKSIL